MKRKEQFEYWQHVGRHVNHRHLFAWFLTINLPIILGLSYFTGWHNELVGNPTPLHLLMRAAVASVAIGVGMMLFWYKAMRLAIRAEREKAEGDSDERVQ